jgi:flagellar biosynthesis chaperone FliJ
VDYKRLKKMLDLTKRVEKARKGELSNARHEQTLALQELERRKGEERAQLRALEESGDLDVHALQDRARGLTLAAAKVQEARTVHVEKDNEVQRREVVAVEAMRDVRKFEILCERSHEELRIAARNAEQQALDETRRTAKRGDR